MTYRLGRLPALFPAGLRELTYYVAGGLPKPPAAVPAPQVAVWDMLGNDQYGDCGVAGLEHGFMVDSVITKWPREKQATAQQAVDYYLRYTGGDDSGVVLSQYLAYVRRHGYYGHSVQVYAPVAVNDVPVLQTAVWLYGFAYTGIVVTQAMMDAFESGQPWTQVDAADTPIGGHCVPIVGYDDTGLTVVTWGQLQQVTWSAWHAIAEEAWAIITGEFVHRNGDGRGVSLKALEADLNKLAA